MSNRTVHGYDRLATSLHKGNVGITTGSSARPGGRTHLADSDTKRTACGRDTTGYATSLVPERIVENPDRLTVHYAMCRKCTAAITG